MGSKHDRGINRRGAIGATDDADAPRLLQRKTQGQGAEDGSEDTELRRRAEEKCFGVGEQGGEVGQRSDAQEYQGRENGQVHAQTEVVKQTPTLHQAGRGNIG